jgi:hypothetical protein
MVKYKHCRICKKKSSREVTIIQASRPLSSLAPGYCLDCQEWTLMGFLCFILGIALVVIGLFQMFRGDYYTLPSGIAILLTGLLFDKIIGLFYRSG